MGTPLPPKITPEEQEKITLQYYRFIGWISCCFVLAKSREESNLVIEKFSLILKKHNINEPQQMLSAALLILTAVGSHMSQVLTVEQRHLIFEYSKEFISNDPAVIESQLQSLKSVPEKEKTITE